MKCLHHAGIALAALLPLGANAALSEPQGKTLAVGDKIPAAAFTEVVWAFDGASGLGDYLGEPVLVDFWGKN